MLLAEFENTRGNAIPQARHVDGAVTLSRIATTRFITEERVGYFDMAARTSVENSSIGSQPESSKSPTDNPGHETPQSSLSCIPKYTAKSQSERQLPQYLLTLTRRLEQSRSIRQSFDTEWPTFYSPAERNGLGALLDKVADLYRNVMPVVTAYYERVQTIMPGDKQQYLRLMQDLLPGVIKARNSIAEYQAMLDDYCGQDAQIYQSCAKPGFPFSPVLKFINPIMAQPLSTPYMFTLFMAPFTSQEEHHESLRYISAVFAGFDDTPGLQIDASFPDLHVAAFWRPGPEREYFTNDIKRRGIAFRTVLARVWGIVDAIGAAQNRTLSNAEILGISFQQYRQGQIEGLKLKNLRH